MTQDENLRRTVRFEKPERIPMNFVINQACWHHYPQDALQELMAEHPLLFPGFEPATETVVPTYSPEARADEPFTDPWGCVWETTDNGIVGTITTHPLADWDALEAYQPPDPQLCDGRHPADWDQAETTIKARQRRGGLASGGLRHGHTFLTLCDLRGYENLIFDMADDEPRLHTLIEMVEAFNLARIRGYLELGVEWMGYPEDLGMQIGPMLSPEHFRRFIKPSYQRLMAPARQAGCIVHMHSDGDIRDLVDDLIDGGVEAINLQDLVNGIDWIAGRFAGNICVDLDIDRQAITPFGTPAQIDAHIRTAIDKIASPNGGLMMTFGLYPGTPLANVKAVMDAMETYADFYA